MIKKGKGVIMRRVRGLDAQISKDHTGGFIGVHWHCPYCGGYNAGFYFTNNVDVLGDSFEIDHACDDCGKMVTIECVDVKDNLFDWAGSADIFGERMTKSL